MRATTYRAPGRFISGLALTPDRSRLYVTWNVPNSDRSGLSVLDPRTGAALADALHFYGGTTASTATVGGVWLANGEAHTETLTFHPADNLARATTRPVYLCRWRLLRR